jgi:nicotinate-nucleotide adenylyltransferase
MVELALLREEGLVVSPLELTPEQACYTVDTLRHFRRHDPEAELFLLIGGDGFAELNTWREWREIARLSQMAVLTRPDWHLPDMRDRLPDEIAELASSSRVHFVRNEAVKVSATEIRKQLAEGGVPPADAVPELVLEYIQKYSLYQ